MLRLNWNRRSFLKSLGTVAAVAGVNSKTFGEAAAGVSIMVDPADELAATKPAHWAADRLAQVLKARGIAVTQVSKPQDAAQGSLCITVAGAKRAATLRMLREAKVSVSDVPEALGLVNVSQAGKRGLLACGHDPRGLVYAVTELADLVENSPDPIKALGAVQTSAERPANEIRSLVRLFSSDIEDKPWYNDRAMWPEYFNLLVTQRFNRFNLAFGGGYNGVVGVKDAYFLFAYPFLLKVPGYDVRVPQLPDAERDHNLEMLKYIGEECTKRGLQFFVGLWMHGYTTPKNSPQSNYFTEGLDERTHGPYCRDAVRMLLKEVPGILGLTLRSHGEAGVAEGSFDFWKTVFEGITSCGRQITLDMQPKGMSQEMMDLLRATKLPVSMGPKYWAEHLGMPYQQADIREQEKPHKDANSPGFWQFSHGERSFLRYGYGDLLTEDRPWKLLYRVVAGSQRFMLYGDPTYTAGYAQAFSFCGSSGSERQESLFFKGSRGLGVAGSRCGYLDPAYDPHWDWQKYEYSLRVWGRALYNPGTKPEVWRRYLHRKFGPGAAAMETALANVTRILPSVTTVYSPSAGNHEYSPELYVNQSMVDAENYLSYKDSQAPRVFGNASPLDPEIFLSANQYAEELLAGKFSGKYSPVDVAQWIEDYASTARAALAQAETSATNRTSAPYLRAKVDIQIQAGIGEFFAAKFRSAVLFHLYEITQEQAALEACIEQYRKARASYEVLANVAKGVYKPDLGISFGQAHQRGYWLDRLPYIDKDIDLVSALLKVAKPGDASPKVAAAIKTVMTRPHRVPLGVHHVEPARFKPGEALSLALTAPAGVASVRLHYRHVNQAEFYVVVPMERQGGQFVASIPEAYTQSAYPLEYYFEVTSEDGNADLHPGFAKEKANQPYFVVRCV